MIIENIETPLRFTVAVGEKEIKEQVDTLLVRGEQECSDENVLKLIRGSYSPHLFAFCFPPFDM